MFVFVLLYIYIYAFEVTAHLHWDEESNMFLATTFYNLLLICCSFNFLF